MLNIKFSISQLLHTALIKLVVAFKMSGAAKATLTAPVAQPMIHTYITSLQFTLQVSKQGSNKTSKLLINQVIYIYIQYTLSSKADNTSFV